MKKQILIIDDDIDLGKILKSILEKNGYLVKNALDGAEAFDILRKEQIDLIVTDLKMEWLEGDVVVRMVKGYEKTAHIPIVVHSGMKKDEMASYKVEGWADAILPKIGDTTPLLETIKELLLNPT